VSNEEHVRKRRKDVGRETSKKTKNIEREKESESD
jgi:hypothetical protein